MRLFHILEQGDRIHAGDEYYSVTTGCWKPVLDDDIGTINGGAFAIRRAVPSIWTLASEGFAISLDADKNGRVLAIDAGGSLHHIPWLEAVADNIVAWCRPADFFALCPPPELELFREFMAKSFPQWIEGGARWDIAKAVWVASQAAGKEVAE